MVAVEFSAALRLAEEAPVGGAAAGTGKVLAFLESIRKRGGVLVAVAPFVGQSFGGKGEYLRSEISRCHPGRNEKPGVVDDEVEVFCCVAEAPADEVVAPDGLPQYTSGTNVWSDIGGRMYPSTS